MITVWIPSTDRKNIRPQGLISHSFAFPAGRKRFCLRGKCALVSGGSIPLYMILVMVLLPVVIDLVTGLHAFILFLLSTFLPLPSISIPY